MSNPLPKRVLLYGVTGSGKSTLATRLGEQTGREVTLVDELTWEPGWVQVSDERQRELIAEIVAKDEWILDSAYAKWVEVVFPHTDLVVGLDYPAPFIFFRLLRRTLLRCIDKKLICNRNVETLKGMLSRDSILIWFFKSYKRKRARIRKWEAAGTPPTLRFTRPSQTEAWLRSFRRP